MIKKLIVALLAFLLILPVGEVVNVKLKEIDKERSREDYSRENHADNTIEITAEPPFVHEESFAQAGFSIYTNYNGVEKYTPILQSIFKGIDVDNNPSTGENGMDIKVSVFILPLIQATDAGWILTVSFALKVIRLDDEIKNGEFEICFGGAISYAGMHRFKIGYYSPENEEIPREIREVVTVVPYLFYSKNPEFYINLEPVFDGENQNVSVIMDYSNLEEHRIVIDYYSAIFSMIKVVPDIGFNKFNFSIEREAGKEQTIRIRYEGITAINLTIEDIPQKMDFSISFSDDEKRFEYEASDEFNASLIIEVFGMTYAMKIEYLPRHLITIFNETGYLYVYINERKTKFIVADNIEEPVNYFTLSNLSGEATIQWKFEGNGYLIVNGFKGMEIEIKAEMGNIYFRIYSIIKAEYFEISWNLSIPGYVFIDTNNESAAFYSFNFTIDDLFGILIESDILKAEDFRVSWQTSIPIFTTEGEIDILSNGVFKIMLNGIWYNIFG